MILRLILDHEKNLREITCKIRETADRMETLVINNNNFVENPTSRKLRGKYRLFLRTGGGGGILSQALQNLKVLYFCMSV